jgi:hypothetical protein
MRRLPRLISKDVTNWTGLYYISPEDYDNYDPWMDNWHWNWDHNEDDEDYFVSDEEYYGFQDLPFFENRWQNLKSRLGLNARDLKWYWGSTIKINNLEHYNYADKLIKNNRGKSFDNTFKYFCKKTKNPEARSSFLEEFEKRPCCYHYYYVDSKGLIQFTDYLIEKLKKKSNSRNYYKWQLSRKQKRDEKRHNQEINNFSYDLVFNSKLSKRKKEWNREILTNKIELYETIFK